MSLADVRMVVLAYGSSGEHGPLLASLASEGLDLDRVLIVHNPSTPGEVLPAAGGCEVLRAERNLGYAAAMNLGIRRQLSRSCELLLLLTHDARLRPGSLRTLIEAAEGEPGYGVLAPTLVLTGTQDPFSYGGDTDRWGNLSHRKELPSGATGLVPCDWVDGGTMLVRAEALTRVGDFDERFWGYCEDADLCLRMTRAGLPVGVVLDATADQAPGAAKRPGPWAYLLTRNGAAYAKSFAGLRGAAFASVLAVWLSLFELLRMAVRSTPLRDGSRSAPWAVAVGRAWGLLDFLRGRWGPPPAGLPGAGDLRNVEAQAGGSAGD